MRRFQRLKRHHRADQELRGRIDQLEKRQIQDDAVLNIINRYWNQLNEDMRVLLQRFDAETSDEFESKSEICWDLLPWIFSPQSTKSC